MELLSYELLEQDEHQVSFLQISTLLYTSASTASSIAFEAHFSAPQWSDLTFH